MTCSLNDVNPTVVFMSLHPRARRPRTSFMSYAFGETIIKMWKPCFVFMFCIDFSFSCLTHEVERKRIFCEWVRSRIPSRRLWNPTSNRNKSSLLFFYCVREQHFIVYVLIFFLRHHNRTVIFYPLLFPAVPAAHTMLGINKGIKIFYEGLVSRNCCWCMHSDIAMNVNNLAGINLNLNLYKPLRPRHPPIHPRTFPFFIFPLV